MISSPLVWILIPAVVAAGLYPLRRWPRLLTWLGTLLALLLALLANRLPIDQPITFGPFSSLPVLQIAPTLTVLGRRFVLGNDLRPVLTLIYLGTAFWLGGAYRASVTRLFVPFGLIMTALLTAALAVEPFLYAALLIEIAVLASIPVLLAPGQPAGRGVIRYLTLQTLGMPFILFAGWLLSGVESNPTDSLLVLRAAAVVGIGFAFLMSVFPFHNWIPMVAEEAHPYAAAFVFYTLPAVVSLFGLGLLDRYAWIRATPIVYEALRLVGVWMVVTGGVWAAFQRNLSRMLGHAATMEIGLALLALSLGFGTSSPAAAPPPAGASSSGADIALLGIFFAQFLPRGLGLAIWAEALATLQQYSVRLDFDDVRGIAHQLPVASAALVLALLSLAGFPLLAGFPIRVALWSALSQQSLSMAVTALIGSAGLMLGGLRTIATLLGMAPSQENQDQWKSAEDWGQRLLLGIGCLLLVMIGLLPQWFLPPLTEIAAIFGRRLP